MYTYNRHIRCSFLIKLGGEQGDQHVELLQLPGPEGTVMSYSTLFLRILYFKRLNRLIFFSLAICMVSPYSSSAGAQLLLAGFRHGPEFSQHSQFQDLTLGYCLMFGHVIYHVDLLNYIALILFSVQISRI